MGVREQLIAAFDPLTGCYYHRDDYRHSNLIDGMAWVGLAVGAAKRSEDACIVELGTRYLQTLLRVGPDARNYAGYQVNEKWIPSPNIEGYYYLQKPQAFEGPAGLCYAGLGKEPLVAPILRTLGWVYGLVYPMFDGYQNSIMTSYLIASKKPPKTLEKVYTSNPFFAAIAGIRWTGEYPPQQRSLLGTTELTTEIQPFSKAEPSAWPFRRNIYNRYVEAGDLDPVSYTPIAAYVGDRLQEMVNA